MGLISDWRQRRTDKAAAARADALHREGARILAAGDFEHAEPALREAAEMRFDLLGPDAVPTLHSRLVRARALQSLGRYADSEAEARSVIEHGAPLEGSVQLVSSARLVRAHALKATGRTAEANAEACTVLAVLPSRLAANTRVAAAHLQANGLIALGRHVEALREQEAFLSEYPDQPIWTAKARSDRAQNLVYLGRFEEAEAECRALIDLASRGSGSHDTFADLASRNALVLALLGLERLTEAESEAGDALDRADRVGGLHPRFTLALRLGLARCLNAREQYREALEILLPAKEDFFRTPGGEYELATALYIGIGTAQLGLGEHREAEDSVRRALAGCRETLGPFHHRALVADTLHGRVLAAQGRQTEARERLTAASAAWREHFGADHPETRAAEQALAELSGRTGG